MEYVQNNPAIHFGFIFLLLESIYNYFNFDRVYTMNIIADQLKLNNDPNALLLIQKINEQGFDANIYYNFPFYRGETKEDLIQAHVLLVSKQYGIIFFRCLESEQAFNEEERRKIESLDSHIFSKVNKREEFRIGRRDLKINLTPFFVVPNLKNPQEGFITIADVPQSITANEKTKLTESEFDILVATIEGTVNLKSKKDRIIPDTEKISKGKVLSILQGYEAVFDNEQKRAALNIIDSPQRIRGLAGSGKTIILTMKAALFHLQNPEANILYTYFTKALHGQVKYLIEKYYRDFSDNKEPDWNKIHILHGWGGRALRGVYSDTCFENNIPPIPLSDAKSNNRKDPFNYVCEQIEKYDLKEKYDLTLIDEGQDFPKYFYRVCRKITKNSRIVWAYDDFQNIFDVDIQDEKETFGKDSRGNYYVDFSRNENSLQDIILYKCYRNPRFSLISAFCLGLGIYNNKVLQRLENNKHWEDLGFVVEKGTSKDNDDMVVSRPERNSPSDTNKYFDQKSISAYTFKDLPKECQFIIDNIVRDVREQGLRPDDICVISLDQRNISTYFEMIQKGLTESGINVFNLLEAPYNNTDFLIENHVTLATINKAKGNETGMVYIVGTDQVFKNKDFIIERNKLFTAITRSKGWVTLTGFEEAKLCERELDLLEKNDFKLVFRQPSKKDTRTILRGMSEQQSFLNDMSRRIQDFSKSAGLTTEQIIRIIQSQTEEKK